MDKKSYQDYLSDSTKDSMVVIHFYATLRGIKMSLEEFRYFFSIYLLHISGGSFIIPQILIAVHNFVYSELNKYFKIE